MHGLETIIAINSKPGLDRVRKNQPLSAHVLDEYHIAMQSVVEQYERGELTVAGMIEELGELEATYE